MCIDRLIGKTFQKIITNMTTLLLLQYTCFLVSLLLAPIIIVSYFIQEGTNRRYERSRWMLVAAAFILALHYFLQMRYSIRATTDTGATVVNILFYTPAAFLFSGSVLGLEGDRRRFRSYSMFGALCTFLILLLFIIGWLRNGCLEMPYVQPIMHAVFFVVMTVFVVIPWKAIKRSRKRVINETGGDIVPYKRFVGSAYLLMSTTLSVLVIAIVWRPLLFVFAPFGLFAIFFYVLCFVYLGFGMAPIRDVLDEEISNEELRGADDDSDIKEKEAVLYPAEMAEKVGLALDKWVKDGGYRDSSTNISKVSREVYLSRRELSEYFDLHLNSTFRIWLSDIRLAEAQKMIAAHPEYSNDTISSSCGFSSRSQLYKIFSDKLGMSPKQWREKNGVEEQTGLNSDENE